MIYKITYECYRFKEWWQCTDTIEGGGLDTNDLLKIVSKREMTTCKNLTYIKGAI